ncbi:MAG TPA: radical SAM protein [Phycisphaerae bacterium]|nr:radical SAM protein [Phycisphaerae bacterium]HRY71289.1 radical SAM protein [Phycisphaerae bacterium]HSA29763.1 radical SAM protein [Phycisphaerae bacterium]
MNHSQFTVHSAAPVYLSPAVRSSLSERVQEATRLLSDCRACPRACGVHRLSGKTGLCRTGRLARISSAFAHRGEESCLSGSRGSGTVFFAGCNLRCVFCQNWELSQGGEGEEYPPEAVADMMLALQAQGCHNINLVTPEHVVPQVVEALVTAIEHGLGLPVVYNTSAYDSVASLRLLDGVVDIYMPDFKLWSRPACTRYLGAEDYADCAREAILEMFRQVGDLVVTPAGLACRGLLVRHLVMPGLLDETSAIMEWLAGELSRDTFVNIMAQYRPDHRVGIGPQSAGSAGCCEFPEINRRASTDEIAAAYTAARRAGLWRFDE